MRRTLGILFVGVFILASIGFCQSDSSKQEPFKNNQISAFLIAWLSSVPEENVYVASSPSDEETRRVFLEILERQPDPKIVRMLKGDIKNRKFSVKLFKRRFDSDPSSSRLTGDLSLLFRSYEESRTILVPQEFLDASPCSQAVSLTAFGLLQRFPLRERFSAIDKRERAVAPKIRTLNDAGALVRGELLKALFNDFERQLNWDLVEFSTIMFNQCSVDEIKTIFPTDFTMTEDAWIQEARFSIKTILDFFRKMIEM